MFDSHVKHLTLAHCRFLLHWDLLIDLEAKATLVSKFFSRVSWQNKETNEKIFVKLKEHLAHCFVAVFNFRLQEKNCCV